VKALVFELDYARLAAARALGALSPRGYVSRLGPLRMKTVPDARILGGRWVLVETRMSGICGSDLKQVFLDAAADNPLQALVSFPHVPGHEPVGTVVEVGREVTRVRRGDRVACYPWLSCVVRGLPECAACRRGQMSLCESFTRGPFSAGMHAGTCRDVSGGFAELMPVHETECFVLPEAVSFDAAVLADPFSVALHAVLKSPPEPGETVLVYGAGGIGALTLLVLATLFPATRVLAVDPREHARDLARRIGARETFGASGKALIEAVAEAIGQPLQRPTFGLPWVHQGVDRVYDTVGAARTLETGLRLLRPLGTLVLVGVAKPARFEWTPLYFKEAAILGSSGYGIESLSAPAADVGVPAARRSDGVRAHAFEHFFALLASGRLDTGGIVTHRFPLTRYKDAFLTARGGGRQPVIKAVFDLG
jgi:threonine dehydrogenase-like Zn-dependent dehydrogenase